MEALAHQSCPQCGAVVERDPTRMSTTCAFCATPLVTASGDSAAEVGMAPARLAPFSLDEQQAADRLQRHLQGRWFLPEQLRKATQAESLRAVMVPFYAFNGIVHTAVETAVGVTYTTGTGDNRRTHTEWFTDFKPHHVLHWHDHLVSASRGVPERLANQLEPFDLGRTQPFDPHLLAGLEAERPSIDPGAAEQVARKELDGLLKRRVQQEACCDLQVRGLKINSDVKLHAVESLLLPIWIATYRGPKGPVSLLVNGQTGRVAGDLPTSTGRALLWTAVILVGLCLLTMGIILGWLFLLLILDVIL